MQKNREKRNEYLKNKRKRDINHRLIVNTRNRLYKALKGLSKSSSTKDILEFKLIENG